MDEPTPKRTKKEYRCDECDKTFTRDTSLIVHKQRHAGVKPWTCEYCEFTCTTKGELESHRRIHTREISYKCDECDAAYTHKNSLVIHKRTHTCEKPFSCDECEAAFGDSSSLAQHKLRHSVLKNYICEDCEKGFFTNSDLRVHQLTHTQDRRWKCDECDSCFKKKDHLTRHILTHSGMQPYSCPHCPRKFSQSGHMHSHVKLHEAQATFAHPCVFNDSSTTLHSEDPTGIACFVRCKTVQDLDYHIGYHHTVEGIAAKFHSETQLAKFFEAQGILYDRDWTNLIQFKGCDTIEGSRVHARPDFYLPIFSSILKCIVLVGNDEFAHRQTKCEFQRIWNIVHALQQTNEFRDVPLLYIRFNPHHYRVGDKFFDVKLEMGHKKLLDCLQSLTAHDIRPGVNLIFIQYDQDAEGNLRVFEQDEDDDKIAIPYSDLYRECVIRIV